MSTNVETTVQDADVNLDDILGTPGSASVMTPAENTEEKQNVLSGDKDTDEFLNNLGKENDDKKEDDKVATPEEVKEMLEIKPKNEEKPVENKIGNAIKKLMEKKVLFGFEGEDKNIDDYTEDDYEELIEANLKYQTEQNVNASAQEMFNNLPPEMQAAFDYVQNGGNDIKGMFKALAETVETRELDPEKVEDQKKIIREFYTMTNWGSIEDIEDEITSLQDKGDLKKKALQFKPKLDASRQDMINMRIENQRKAEEQRRKQAENYANSMYNTLNKPTLGGIAIDNETRNKLYYGLMRTSYPSITGGKTNMLGYLLEKYQWAEPRHDLIAEVLWHLADPDAFKKAISDNAEKKTLEKTMRNLKTEEQSSRKPSSQRTETVNPTIPRPTKGFFTR